MLAKIFHTLFPKRQLFLRQNGEVKFLDLSPMSQVVVLVVVIFLCLMTVISCYQSASLSHALTEKEASLATQKANLKKLETQYQKNHQLLRDELDALNQQSLLMKNMLDSLPEAERLKLESTIEQNPEQKDEKQTELNQAVQKVSNTINLQFSQLDHVIASRSEKLNAALVKAGLNSQDFLNDNTAQGGPFYELPLSDFTEQQTNLLDKVIYLNNLTNQLTLLPTTLPAKDFYVSSSYGYRTDPITKRRSFHKGIDMAGWHKTKIYAPSAGKVIRAGKNGGYGNFIEIKHSNGFVTRYGHLARIKVKRGEIVEKEQIIGLMGSSGRSTSTHLHYEVIHNGKNINPLKLTRAFENVI